MSQVCPSPNSNPMIAQSQQATYSTIVSCFPQMKPENRTEGELTRTEGSSNKALELSEEEKLLMNILNDNSPMDLNELKGLTKNKVARVEKTDAGLLVSLV